MKIFADNVTSPAKFMKCTMTNILLKASIVFTAGSPFLSATDNGTDRTSHSEKMLYTMKAGDTLRDLARRLLGGEEYLAELLEYNKIRNPLLAGEGFMLMIPGEERDQAIRELIGAREMLARAVDAMAEEFAADEYSLARETVDAGEENRRIGAYDKAAALARLGNVRAEYAIEVANTRARVQQGGEITAVHGTVKLSKDTAKSWVAVSEGDKVTVDTIIRTGRNSRAEITLEDGSVIQLLESSEFILRTFMYDLRSGRRTSQLEVILGNILGKIKPKEVKESTFEVKSGSAALGIRGTDLRIGVNMKQTSRISVLNGEILVNANRREVVVPANFGTFTEKEKPPAEPVELLPPPKITSPAGFVYETRVQMLDVSWEHVKIVPKKITQRVTNYLFNKFATYHLEIAADIKFNFIVEDHITSENTIRTDVLSPGEYYWRVASIDNNGLEGPFIQVRKLRIIRDLTVVIIPETPPIELHGKWLILPTNRLNVVPITDDTSVDHLEYSLNDQPFLPFESTLSFKQDGTYLLKVRGIGADGKPGEIIERTIQVDGTPPVISIDISPRQDDPDLGEVVYATIDVSDESDLEVLECRINDEPYQPYEDRIPISVGREPGGVYIKGGNVFGKVVLDKNLRKSIKVNLSCRAVDAVGNESIESISLKY